LDREVVAGWIPRHRDLLITEPAPRYRHDCLASALAEATSHACIGAPRGLPSARASLTDATESSAMAVAGNNREAKHDIPYEIARTTARVRAERPRVE
jgi:hypothetical protein